MLYCNFYKHISSPIQPVSLQLAKLKEINTALVQKGVRTLFPDTQNPIIRVACDVYSKNFLTVLCESTDPELLINREVSEVITNAYNQFELNELDGINSKNAELKELLLKAKTLIVLSNVQTSQIQSNANDVRKIIEEKSVIYFSMKNLQFELLNVNHKIPPLVQEVNSQIRGVIADVVGTAPCSIINNDTSFIFLYLIFIKMEKFSIMIEHNQPFIRLLKKMIDDCKWEEFHENFKYILSIHRALKKQVDEDCMKLKDALCRMSERMAQTKRDYLKKWKTAQKRLSSEEKAAGKTSKIKKKTAKKSKQRKK